MNCPVLLVSRYLPSDTGGAKE